MTLTLAITNYNRYELLKESFAQVIDDVRIGEILIVDDHSEWAIYQKVNELTNLHDKIKVVRQVANRGMGKNKADAIALSKHDWVIIFDSDNVLPVSYLDALPEELYSDTIYVPSFARPEFNFNQYAGLPFDKKNVSRFIKDPQFSALLNCCNYVVNKLEYGKVYKEDKNIDAADTIRFNHDWLKAGNTFFVVPGMEYMHRVHKNSGFLKDINKNMQDAERIKKQISNL